MEMQQKLTEELINASKGYYNDGNTPLSDIEFDRKLEELRQMEKESGVVLPNSPTNSVGAKAGKVAHEKPALSLAKYKYAQMQELEEWLKDHSSPACPPVCMWKMDGSTIVLTYDNGKLTSAVTRGDGYEGTDITRNARYFNGVPSVIKTDEKHLVVRGEVVMKNSDFEMCNVDGEFENARNLATATIQMKDPEESKKRPVWFYAFELVHPEPQVGEGMTTRLKHLKELGFNVVEFQYVDMNDIHSFIDGWQAKLPSLDFPTDGLVFSMEDLYNGWKLGTTGHHPRWSIAMKWTDETSRSTLRSVEWSVGSKGSITPVAVFDSIRLGIGSNVTRASLHNISCLRNIPFERGENSNRVYLALGDDVNVYLANMIIPQIASFTWGDYKETRRTSIEIPAYCPACGSPTRQAEHNGVWTLHCDNELCTARVMGRYLTMFGKDGLNVKGLGESQLKDLVTVGILRTPKDLFEMAYLYNNRELSEYGKNELRKLMALDGWGETSVHNLMLALEEARSTTLQRFIYSLAIPMVGHDFSKKLSKHFHNKYLEFLDYVYLYDEDMQDEENNAIREIDGIGEEKVSRLVAFLDKNENRDMLLDLADELTFEEGPLSSEQFLEGFTFVITGKVNIYSNRDEFKASVEARGGKVAGSVSKNTTLLVNNDMESTSGKNKKAKELGIEIISEAEFIRRFGK